MLRGMYVFTHTQTHTHIYSHVHDITWSFLEVFLLISVCSGLISSCSFLSVSFVALRPAAFSLSLGRRSSLQPSHSVHPSVCGMLSTSFLSVSLSLCLPIHDQKFSSPTFPQKTFLGKCYYSEVFEKKSLLCKTAFVWSNCSKSSNIVK